ncbi:right-handed parallel beta-helix repeat-containing protein [Bacillus licheniformis]|uniref:right-handed parallel beta-helix repeat-containing protein n=1 Tax=Bacillus licheniformis TaxID=1402 RepID=UPI0011A1433E|nr:right-handed parallel beta-helix repeat-containing protein [Bacillus licheniformis]MDE1403228.1 right-handed parallel beta-helix repeat-containing protein [Bacillus licheniformis]TWL74993.1 Plasmin and fibronectin-binding protein A [Bacillus licheniformis]
MNTLSFYNKKKDKWEDIYTTGITNGKTVVNANELFESLTEISDSHIDSHSNSHNTLKDRLDYEHNQLNHDLESRSLNVLNYLIAGELDMSLCIQRALEDAYKKGGAQVYVPARPTPYILKKTLFIKENTSLILNENAVFDRQHIDDFIVNFKKEKGNSKLTGYNGYSNITIEGGIWRSNGDVYKGGQAILLAHAKNVTVRNLTIYDVYGGHAVEFNGIDTGVIENVKAFGFTGQYYRGAFQIDLDKDGNPPTLGEYGSFDGTPCKNITVKKCAVGASEKMGSWGRAVESHSSYIGISHENIRIEKNKIHGTQDAAIRAYAWNDVYIAGNQITNCGSGIIINSPLLDKPEDTVNLECKQTNGSQKQSNITIENNTIDTTTLASGLLGGIGVWGQGKGGTLLNVIVHNNTIKNTANNADGIYIKEAHFIKIKTNHLEKIGYNGIVAVGARFGNITENSISETAITGIYVSSSESNSESVQVNNNIVMNGGGHGIHLTNETQKSQVHSNTVVNMGNKELNRYNGIYITTKCKHISIRNNDIYSSSKKLIAGVLITSANSNIVESANYIPNSEFYYQKPIVNQAS